MHGTTEVAQTDGHTHTKVANICTHLDRHLHHTKREKMEIKRASGLGENSEGILCGKNVVLVVKTLIEK